MNNGGAMLTADDMPIPGSKHAPKKFKGSYSDIKPFLQHYSQLCRRYNVTSAKQKSDLILQYCSQSVKECIQSLPGFGDDWDKLS